MEMTLIMLNIFPSLHPHLFSLEQKKTPNCSPQTLGRQHGDKQVECTFYYRCEPSCANHCHTSEEFSSSALIDLEAHVTPCIKKVKGRLSFTQRFSNDSDSSSGGFLQHKASPPQSCVAIALHGTPQIKRKALYADAYFPLIRANVHQSRHTALPPHCGSQGGQERSKPPLPSPLYPTPPTCT